jgi:hypothetical protein
MLPLKLSGTYGLIRPSAAGGKPSLPAIETLNAMLTACHWHAVSFFEFSLGASTALMIERAKRVPCRRAG